MVVIRPLALDELPLLESHMPRRMPGVHRKRLASQAEGEAVYLVAWQDDAPVGHLLIRWQGTDAEAVTAALPGCPDLSDIAVHPDRQSRGIGSQLMERAERLIAARGRRRVGLSVALDNVRARSLYERRGYSDAGLGEFRIRWPYLDDQGRERWCEETCIYLVKDLPHVG